jgi:1-deoxy-D-xylulose-5-phosphate reductoisomerase
VISVGVAGSSGSIGVQTLEIVRREPQRFRVASLAVGSSLATLLEQIEEFRPEVVVVSNDETRRDVTDAVGDRVAVSGDLVDVVSGADVVINGIVGFAGLAVTTATLSSGRRLGLANKESLIAAGPVVQPLRSTPGAELIPVDSEHCAIHQCLRSSTEIDREVGRVVLTASGGPFRGRSATELADVTVEEALAHPTWSMGPKITVDSSTLMNKGLEVIEAHELFGVDYDRIEVVVHPQSIVHSMVEFVDGSTIAQLSEPDMRLPIGYAMAWPDRLQSAFGRLDWEQMSRLDFELPDRVTFRALDLAYQAGRAGGSAPAWLSAANEVAVESFLDREIRWNQIPDVCAGVLERHDGAMVSTLDEVIEADRAARVHAGEIVRQLVGR